ncbi:hypothetical protein LMG19087_02146 [Ralstonia wenshanensis]|uniref:hypothetical protein n=1 Tax=Ralstonia wenshanensis TaxID=2842456 RepID=UPI0028F636DA|nr:hypothetical protein [Ralstonia wenshanensis]CAJ0814569.1 hypothetical protein LMG19087_02146 [Ralstonia wenshanensis]
MSDYSVAELEDIIAAGEAKLEELQGQLALLDGDDGDEAAGDLLFGVIDGLEDRLWELRNDLVSLQEQEAQYEADRAEAVGLYTEQGGELDDTGMPLDDGLFGDVFFQMQEERIDNGLL